MSGHRNRPYAAVDIGTNTVRLLVAEVVATHSIRWIDRRAIVTRLGQGVDAVGELSAEAIGRTCDVLSEYGDAIEAAGCQAAAAVATSAVRDAGNRDAFLDAAGAALGFRPDVIGGDEEAELTFAGTTGHLDRDGPFLVIDPGGGSTEFVMGSDAPSFRISIDIGSVRLTERMLPEVPAAPAALDAARAHVAALMAAELRLPDRPVAVFGVAGTYTSLAAMHLGLERYDSDRVHGTVLTGADLLGLSDRLAAMTLEQIVAIPSMDPKRAPVITGGAVVAEQALRHVGADEITVSERDILDGVIRRLAANSRN